MIYTYFNTSSKVFGNYTTISELARHHNLNAQSLRVAFSRGKTDIITLRCGAVVFRGSLVKCPNLIRLPK